MGSLGRNSLLEGPPLGDSNSVSPLLILHCSSIGVVVHLPSTTVVDSGEIDLRRVDFLGISG